MKKSMSISTKNLIFTMCNIILLGLILTVSSYIIQGQVLLDQLHRDSYNVVRFWANQLNKQDIMSASKNHDPNSDIQRSLTAQMDSISRYNPNIAQAYVFGVELENGNMTSILIQPSRIMKHMDSLGLKLGDMLEQPDRIVKGIESMLSTGGDVVTPAYSDTVGTWVTVLSPIRDENGQIFAYFGLDIDATMIHVGQVKLFALATIIMTILFVASIFLQIYMNRRTFSPFKTLVNAIDEVSVGNYNSTLREGTDELGKVNSRFNVMTSRISSLMETVKKTASQLALHSENLVKLAEGSKETSAKINMHVNIMSEIVTSQGTATVEIADCLEEVVENVQDIVSALDRLHQISEKANKMSSSNYNQLSDALDRWSVYKKSPELSLSVMRNVSAKLVQASVIVEELQEVSSPNPDLEKLQDILNSLQDESNLESERMAERLEAWDTKIADSRNIVEISSTVSSLMTEVVNSILEIRASSYLRAVELQEIHSLVHQYSEAASKNGENARGIAGDASTQQKIFQKVVYSAEDLKGMAKDLDDILHDLNVQNK